MKNIIAVNLNSAMNAYRALTSGLGAILSVAVKLDTIEYQKTRSEVAESAEVLIRNFMEGSATTVVTKMVDIAHENAQADLGVAIGPNEKLAAFQAIGVDAMRMREVLKRISESSRHSFNAVLYKAAVSRHASEPFNPLDIKINARMVDAMGRILPGDGFAEMAFKKHMIDAYVSAYGELVRQMGYDTIEAVYDSEHRNQGLRMSISGTGRYASLLEKRRDVFHPNTGAIPKVVTNAV